jgi:hypothetical protein
MDMSSAAEDKVLFLQCCRKMAFRSGTVKMESRRAAVAPERDREIRLQRPG